MNQINYFITLFCISDQKYTIQSFKNYIASFMSLKAKCLRFNPAHSTVEEQDQSLQITKEYLQEIKDHSTLIEVCIPHSNAKPRLNLPTKELCREYKRGEIIKLYKQNNEEHFSGNLEHLNISVGKKLTWGEWIGLFEIVADNDDYIELKFNRDQRIDHSRKPVVILDSKTNRSYSFSQKDLELIDVCVKNNINIISCSFSTNRDVIEDYIKQIEKSVNKYKTKRPLIILKLEEGEFVNSDNIEYLKSIKDRFNGLSISRGDLYCNDGFSAPIYESRLLKFAKDEQIPIRVFTMVGEDYNGGFSRNSLSCIYNYIKNGIDMVGFSDESIQLHPSQIQEMIDDIEKLAYGHRIETLNKENLSEEDFNNIKFLVPINFTGILKNTNLYINSFNNIDEYLKYCLFKGTIII